MKKRILILGGSGMLGSMLVRELSGNHEVHASLHGGELYGMEKFAAIHTGIDAGNEIALASLIKKIHPQYIINCVGVIKQIINSEAAENIIAINAVLPHQLAWLAKDNGAKLIHFSTDCVFLGRKGPYSEKDRPDIPAADIYGATKLWGEVNDGHALTIRTSFIGPELKGRHSFFEWALSNRGKTIEGYSNVLYSGVTTLEMAKIISMLIEKFPDLSGIWQVAGEPISKYSLLLLINEIFDLNIAIKKNSSIICDRRLDASAFQNKTGYAPKSWMAMISELKEFYAEKNNPK